MRVVVPAFMAELVAAITQAARRSSHVNQRSGVSVRLSIANQETLAANALRRALRTGEKEAVPRVSDLPALAASTAGKVEIEALEEGRDAEIVERLVKGGAGDLPGPLPPGTLPRPGGRLRRRPRGRDGRGRALGRLRRPGRSARASRSLLADLGVGEAPAEVASAVEFVLEGLHLSKRLNKDA